MHQELLYTHSAILEIAPGPYPRRIHCSFTVDALPGPDVDVVCDIFSYLSSLPDSSIYCIHSSHFLEHIQDLELLFNEFSRVLMHQGLMFHTVPHFSNPYFYSDPTHVRHFGLYSMSYLCKSSLFNRSLPSYSCHESLKLTSVFLGFKCPRHFYYLFIFRKFYEIFVNSSSLFQELHEFLLTWVFPPSEVSYVIRRL